MNFLLYISIILCTCITYIYAFDVIYGPPEHVLAFYYHCYSGRVKLEDIAINREILEKFTTFEKLVSNTEVTQLSNAQLQKFRESLNNCRVRNPNYVPGQNEEYLIDHIAQAEILEDVSRKMTQGRQMNIDKIKTKNKSAKDFTTLLNNIAESVKDTNYQLRYVIADKAKKIQRGRMNAFITANDYSIPGYKKYFGTLENKINREQHTVSLGKRGINRVKEFILEIKKDTIGKLKKLAQDNHVQNLEAYAAIIEQCV
jgi:hypothetical protein